MTDAPRKSDLPDVVKQRELTELTRLFDASSWNALDVEIHGMRLVLGREGPPAIVNPRRPATVPTEGPGTAGSAAPSSPPATSADSPTSADAPSEATPTEASEADRGDRGDRAAVTANQVEVRAPVVGTFWVAPSPGQPPFVEVGDEVEAGQQLAIVEVMKLMNDVSSPVAGRVVDVRAENAELVEYEQVLFVLERAE